MSLKIVALVILVINYVYGKHQRIIGGYNAERHEFPYQAVLRHITDNILVCGGAIVSHYHILTVAHCVDEYSLPHNELKISLGDANRTHLFRSEYLPSRIIIHPNYTRGDNEIVAPSNDIAVIKINGTIDFNNYQSMIMLPDRDVKNAELAVLSGWGSLTYPSLTFPDRMQTIYMVTMVPIVCQRKLPLIISNNQFCALLNKDYGPCIGDGGNPLVIDDKLLGLFSISYLCALGLPDIYTNVYAHKPFITSAMEA